MRVWLGFLLVSATCQLTSCSGGAGDSADFAQGPFDKNGNYRDDWADSRPKWADKGSATKKKAKTRARSTVRKSKKASERIVKSTREKVEPRVVSRTVIPSVPSVADVPRTISQVSPPVVRAAPIPAAAPLRPVPQVAPKPKPKPVVRVAPKPKPKPKPVVRVAPKPVLVAVPKPVPAVYHTVAKGDTLYSLSRRYQTTVSAIQKLNDVRGTNIRTGQRLRMP